MFQFTKDIAEIKNNTNEIKQQIIITNNALKIISNKIPTIVSNVINISNSIPTINTNIVGFRNDLSEVIKVLNAIFDRLSKLDDLIIAINKVNQNLVSINETLKNIEKKLPKL